MLNFSSQSPQQRFLLFLDQNVSHRDVCICKTWYSTAKPPQLGMDTKIAAITDAMTEIKTERATLDSKRLHQVQQSVDEVQQSMDEMQRNVTSTNGAVEGRMRI